MTTSEKSNSSSNTISVEFAEEFTDGDSLGIIDVIRKRVAAALAAGERERYLEDLQLPWEAVESDGWAVHSMTSAPLTEAQAKLRAAAPELAAALVEMADAPVR